MTPPMMACNEFFNVFQQRAIKVSSLPLNLANTLLIPVEITCISQKRQIHVHAVADEIRVASSLLLLQSSITQSRAFQKPSDVFRMCL